MATLKVAEAIIGTRVWFPVTGWTERLIELAGEMICQRQVVDHEVVHQAGIGGICGCRFQLYTWRWKRWKLLPVTDPSSNYRSKLLTLVPTKDHQTWRRCSDYSDNRRPQGSRQIKISWYFKTVIVRAECFGEDARTRGSHLWQTPRYISSWKYIACSFSLSEPKHVISARQISIDHRCAGNKSHSPTHPYPYTPHPLQCSQSVTRPQDWSTDATFYIWKAIRLFLRTSCKFVWQPYLRRLTAWHDCKIFWSASWGIFYIVALQGEFVSSGAARGDWWREQQWYDVQRFVM